MASDAKSSFAAPSFAWHLSFLIHFPWSLPPRFSLVCPVQVHVLRCSGSAATQAVATSSNVLTWPESNITRENHSILIRAGNPTFLSQSVITLLELATNPKGRHNAKLVNTPCSYEIGWTAYYNGTYTYMYCYMVGALAPDRLQELSWVRAG